MFAAVIVVVLVLCIAVVVAIARDRGPVPEDVAVSYELAWDRLDFATLWTLSGAELRDGLDRKAYVAAKRVAYATQQGLRALGAKVNVEDVAQRGDVALVSTLVVPGDGAGVRNRVRLARRNGRWVVVAYLLASDRPAPTAGNS